MPDRWLRTGLIAAGIAVIVAGAMIMRAQTQVSRMAYETVADPATVDLFDVAERANLTEQQVRLRVLTGRR